MGKYAGFVDTGEILTAIANELAEMNRLKRYVLRMKYGTNDLGSDGLHHWVADEEIDDLV